MFIAAVGEI